MISLIALVFSIGLTAHASTTTVYVDPNTTIEQFQNWMLEAAADSSSVQFEFSNLATTFNPLDQIMVGEEIAKSHGDIYFLIGDLTNSWSEEEYVAYFPVAKWLSLNGFRAIINPAVYIQDVRDAVKSETTRGIIWSSHGSEEGEIFDKSERPLPKNIFSIDAAPGLKHFVLGDCYGERVAAHYSFPKDAGIHHWTGEITSEDFFKYLKSSAWHDDLRQDLRVKTKKKR